MISINDTLKLVLPDLNMAEPLFQLIIKNKMHLRPWLNWLDKATDVSFTKNFITASLLQYSNGQSIPLMIIYEGKLTGRIGLYNLDSQNYIAEIGYWLDSNYQNNGIIQQCAKALIAYTFSTTTINRIELKCQLNNRASVIIAQKLGFNLEATLKQAAFINDAYVDLYLFALCRNEYLKAMPDK
ncbi:MAG: GNAT family N-acetyltransferase [Bacteroidia bacterium]|nr:GNAT family N-acetyltransferase [Bacteroidia bacterium]